MNRSLEDFAALRRFLSESNYTEAAIRERLGIAALSQTVRLRTGGPRADALDSLIRLFLLEESIPAEWIPPEIAALLRRLRLLDAAGAATVKLYPVRDVYVISDRDFRTRASADHVFSAISPQTEDFLRMVPETKCPSCLEICAGAAPGALLAAAHYAAQAFAFDISERCSQFAEFSRRLNGLRNLTVLRGDLYAPAGNRTFDRILAHPPYVPSLKTAQVFRDGGEDGEWLTRRIVEGLPNYLHPGGRLYLTTMLADYPGDSIPARMRRWLRSAESQFDIVVAHRKRYDAGNFLFENAAIDDIPAWRQLLEQRRIQWFRFVTAIVERHREDAPPVTVSREAGETFTISDAERALKIHGERPLAPAGLKRAAHGVLEDGVWRERGWRFRIEEPFRVEIDGPRWAAEVLARCNGESTFAELGGGREEVVAFLRECVHAGLLQAN